MEKVNAIVKWFAQIKKTLAALGAALTITAEVVSDGKVEGGVLPPSGEVLTLGAAWLAVFGVYWFTNSKAKSKE